MTQPLVVFVDVDDTLLRHAGTKRIPMPASIRHVRELHQAGATMFCWSTGGATYAREAAESVGVAECFDGFLPKPNVILDDQAVTDWRQCVEVTPSESAGRQAADYLTMIGR
jgi:hypothetical protein